MTFFQGLMGSSDISGTNEDLFEISDFTVVSDIEAFCLSLENAISELQKFLHDQDQDTDIDNGKINVDENKLGVEYGKFHFKLKYFSYDKSFPKYDGSEDVPLFHLSSATNQIRSPECDFTDVSLITRQFGVWEYILLIHTTKELIISEENYNSIMSAINIALLNSECTIPFFIPYGDCARNLYFGAHQNRNLRTEFEGVQLKSCLCKHKFMSGLLDLFKEKVNVPYNLDREIYVSVQLDYFTKKLAFDRSTESLSLEKAQITQSEPCKHNYPFGADRDPFEQLNLSVSWKNVTEYAISETPDYSDLDPMSAPRWFLSVQFHGDSIFQLSTLFNSLLKYRDEAPLAPINSMASQSAARQKSSMQSQTSKHNPLDALARLTEDDGDLFNKGVEAGAKIFGAIGSQQDIGKQDRHKKCINFIVDESTEFQHEVLLTDNDTCTNEQRSFLVQFMEVINSSKTAPMGSLTRRLACCLALKILDSTSESSQGLADFANLWMEFVHFLYNHWEKGSNLPSFSNDDKPDLSCSLLHQKLQMLQFCIVTKRTRNECEHANSAEHDELQTPSNDIEEDDEFFDANESFSITTTLKDLKPAKGVSHHLPIGPLTCLLMYPERPIAVPFTQDRGPMSEDMLDKYTNYLVSLEDGDDRIRAQLETLFSDMEAFKAANPGCILEDFVRWHSPRDWVQYNEGSPEGELSERMRLPGNIWQEAWNDAKPVPVSRQKRLFNETTVANTILEYFSNITVQQLTDLILPIVSVDVATVIAKNAIPCLPLVKKELLEMSDLIRQANKKMNSDEFYDIKSLVEFTETTVAKYNSINSLFSTQELLDTIIESDISFTPMVSPQDLRQFIIELLKEEQTPQLSLSNSSATKQLRIVDAPLGPLAKLIWNCMTENDDTECNDEEQTKKIKLDPFRKQYVLRWLVPRPGLASRLMPQRMYASIAQDEFLLCGSFTSDLTYM